MLKSKHKFTTEDCERLLTELKANPPMERSEFLVSQAIDRIEQLEGNLAFAWSGGKDSQAIRFVAEQAGVNLGMCVESGLEWPVMNEWRSKRCDNITILRMDEYNAEWLNDHLEHLFPYNSKIVAQFSKATQHKGQERFYQDNNLDGLLLGRRWADDNWTGFGAGAMSYSSKKTGMTRHSPIADWSHEDLLGVMICYDLEFAPCYFMLDGWVNGTATWKRSHKRNGQPIEDLVSSYDWNFGCVYQTDPQVVVDAAEVLEPAAIWLDNLETNNE